MESRHNNEPHDYYSNNWNRGVWSSIWKIGTIQDIGSGAKHMNYYSRETIYREADRIDKVYIILAGMVKLLSYLPNGRARIVRLHTQDHWIGLEGLIGNIYNHTAISVGAVEVLAIPLQSLRAMEQKNPRQFLQVLKNGYTHLSQADMWIANLSTGNIKPRVARLVTFLSEFEYGEFSNRVNLLTVHEMADILGITPESVSRVLAEFKRNATLNKLNDNTNEAYEIDVKQLSQEAIQ